MKKVKAFFHGLGIILVIIAIALCVVGSMMYQFHVYQKKHGKHMTFLDWLMDSETR